MFPFFIGREVLEQILSFFLMRITTMTGDLQNCHQCESIERVHGDEGDCVVVQITATIHQQIPSQNHEAI